MTSTFLPPKKGFIFWPVGTGDSTTIVVKENMIFLQIDLHHMEKSEESDESAWPIVDDLTRILPKKGNKPYLSVFALTHPDKDHILGFARLLDEVRIGEIWHTPRIFTEYKKDLTDDAKAFRDEVERRRDATIRQQGNVSSGDLVRVIGFDDILKEKEYKGFPKNRISVPGQSILTLDDVTVSDSFEAFVHAPFKDDSEATRNNTSLALHITLKDKNAIAQALFFGDREYPSVKQIFEVTVQNKNEQYLRWDLLLCPHHCSKKVMYWKDEGEQAESLRKDVMQFFEGNKKSNAYVIASARAEFSDGEGDNPPHGKARKQYEKIVDAGHFICTHEWPNEEAPEPVRFELEQTGFSLTKTKTSDSSRLSAAVAVARGGEAPPQQQVGFGEEV